MLKDSYNSNIGVLHKFLATELSDSIIIPVLTSNIAINSGNDDYSNFAYSNFELNCNEGLSLNKPTKLLLQVLSAFDLRAQLLHPALHGSLVAGSMREV